MSDIPQPQKVITTFLDWDWSDQDSMAEWEWSEQDLIGYPPYSQSTYRHGNVVIAPPQDPAAMQGYGAVTSAAFGPLTALPPKDEGQPVAEEPADILWSPIARILMSPTHYRTSWVQHISDMNYERHECLKRNDQWGARRAVLRAHYYSPPRGFWVAAGAFLLWLLRHWLPV
jgi:hypothetical protein